MFENVLKKGKIGSAELKNRFVMPAMGAGHSEVDGSIGDELLEYYAARARGGFGLIITEYVGVDHFGMGARNELRIYSDDYIPELRKLSDVVHAGGAKVFMQLHHGGKWADPHIFGQPTVSASAITWHIRDCVPRELTTEEVYDLIEKWGDAALRAKNAGYDGVELHGAHGYLLPQFMSTYTNRRVDEFGGDITGRARFPTDVIKNIKQKCGAGFPVIVRISGDETAVGAMRINETRVMAKLLERAGADALHISAGMPSAYGDKGYSLAPYTAPMGFNTYSAEEIKKSVKIPIITVGRIVDPAMADAVIEDGMADFVALGRASVADPEFPNKVLEGRIDEISPCIGCMSLCLAGPGPDGITPGNSCALNPFSGHETDMKLKPAGKSKKLVIVGGGVGGLEAAWVAAARGHKVVLLEKKGKPGGQAYTAAVPPNKQGFVLAIKYYMTMCKKYGVDIRLNTEADADTVVSLEPDTVILSTGAVPAGLQVPNDGIAVSQAADILNGETIPGKKVLVVGGGLVGLETADFLLTQMSSVTVVEMSAQVGEDLVVKDALLKTLRDGGVNVMVNTRVERFTRDGAVCSTPEGEITISGCDMAILAVGALPYNPLEEQLRGRVPEIHVIGDAAEARRVKDAVREGAELAVRI
ncbi:MAG: NAD(P)/FAD-dependent oxidoreductase [Oscillospiraceae bacterium]|jgi:2,4-dienoyl-CoA reductase-like NADH-dependent reductase (Old Yellow Enzyme family)/thioredoxin reductase|nr:NAD(P)/FAD-dependent oxidoreductase [Oscillospiraceae bacterium]